MPGTHRTPHRDGAEELDQPLVGIAPGVALLVHQALEHRRREALVGGAVRLHPLAPLQLSASSQAAMLASWSGVASKPSIAWKNGSRSAR